MELTQWSAAVTGELVAAGFTVNLYRGFPLVKMPSTPDAIRRLLKLKLSLACDLTVYAEGGLFTPVGAMRKAQEELGG